MVSVCSKETQAKPISRKREKSSSEMLSELTTGVANWISRPSQSWNHRRNRSDSSESFSSTASLSSDDSKSSARVSSPTDVTSAGRGLLKSSSRVIASQIAPKLQQVARLRKAAATSERGDVDDTALASTSPRWQGRRSCTPSKIESSDKPLWPCVLYGACACLIHLVNKGFFNVWGFKGTFVFSLVQSLVTCCLFLVAYASGAWRLPTIGWKLQRRMLLLPVLFVCNTSFALVGLQHTVLPMYLVLRRMVTPAVLLGEYLVWGRTSSRGVMCACGMLFAGSVVAGASDLKIDLFGYACTTVANVFTVAYTLYMKELSSVCGKMQVADIIFFNAFYSIPLLAMAAMVSGELEAAYAYPHLSSALFQHLRSQVSLVAASVMGILYQGAMVLANTKTSPLATSIAGNVKDIACTVVGYTLFDSGPPTPTNLAGLSMSMGGAFWYMALKTNLLAE